MGMPPFFGRRHEPSPSYEDDRHRAAPPPGTYTDGPGFVAALLGGLVPKPPASAPVKNPEHPDYAGNNDNPDPDNFLIERVEVVGKLVIAKVYYPNCTNYEGRKVLVYRASFAELSAQKRLDPHFAKDGFAPIARFQPTEEGWAMAQAFVVAWGER